MVDIEKRLNQPKTEYIQHVDTKSLFHMPPGQIESFF